MMHWWALYCINQKALVTRVQQQYNWWEEEREWGCLCRIQNFNKHLKLCSQVNTHEGFQLQCVLSLSYMSQYMAGITLRFSNRKLRLVPRQWLTNLVSKAQSSLTNKSTDIGICSNESRYMWVWFSKSKVYLTWSFALIILDKPCILWKIPWCMLCNIWVFIW